eukprot:5761904-Pyramimonas_sp.AAC.1
MRCFELDQLDGRPIAQCPDALVADEKITSSRYSARERGGHRDPTSAPALVSQGPDLDETVGEILPFDSA